MLVTIFTVVLELLVIFVSLALILWFASTVIRIVEGDTLRETLKEDKEFCRDFTRRLRS